MINRIFTIHGCHPWMKNMEEDDKWHRWTQPLCPANIYRQICISLRTLETNGRKHLQCIYLTLIWYSYQIGGYLGPISFNAHLILHLYSYKWVCDLHSSTPTTFFQPTCLYMSLLIYQTSKIIIFPPCLFSYPTQLLRL